MFNTFSQQQQRQRQPSYGAEYNVPADQIRGPGNSVNINAGADATSRGDAFSAFSRLYTPYLQQSADMLTGMGARPIDAQGAPMPGAAPQYGPEDIQGALSRMFGQVEDEKLMRGYFGMPTFRQQPPNVWR